MVHHSPDAIAPERADPPVAPLSALDLLATFDGMQSPADRRRLYRRVIASRRWKQLRARAIARAGGRCERCGRTFGRRWAAQATVHHRHYATLGAEALSDVEALCQLCHAREHGNVPAWLR